MMSTQGYRYALYHSLLGDVAFRRTAGARRFVWNQAVAYQLSVKDAGQPVPRYAAMCAKLLEWKTEYPWLKEVHSQVLQQALKDLDRVWAKRFKDLAALKQGRIRPDEVAGEPGFRRRGQGDTFRYPQPKAEHLDTENGRVFLPKLGWFRYRDSRKPQGRLCQVTITLDGKDWFVSLTTERECLLPCAGEMVGIDRGVTDTVALSTGQRTPSAAFLKKSQHRLRRYQRSVSRKIEAQKKALGLDPKAPFPKGVRPKKSNRQRQAESKVARCQRTIAHQRQDWLHKLTTKIADDAAVVVLEDLSIKAMSASAKGSAETPGRNVRQKAGLNRSILDQGWGLLEQMLIYKTSRRGGEVIKVPAPYTSQRCSACGHVDKASRKKKQFVCTRCAHADDADINAAKNVLAAGLAVLACRPVATGNAGVEDTGQSARPVKRQPTNNDQHPPI